MRDRWREGGVLIGGEGGGGYWVRDRVRSVTEGEVEKGRPTS